MPLRLYNTLTRRLEEFRPADPSRITFYSCGPTVYDDAHIGNFRSFLAADLLRRWIESPLCTLVNSSSGTPRRVDHVMNITDVGHMTDDDAADGGGEDKMAVAGRRIEEAKKSGKLPAGVTIDPRDPYQVARFYETRFKEDAKRLGLKLVIEAEKDATLMPRATESVQGMIAMIERLIARGHAYVVGKSGERVVYFRVQSMPSYGKLSGNTLEKLRAGEGGRVSESNQATKEHPADFLLWKEDPSHIMKWESPWGWGYPGWHIECSVMSANRLLARDANAGGSASIFETRLPNGAPIIDLHSGGEDNIFPHHECEIAQSCACFNETPDSGTYAKMWFHPRFLMVEGTKMSKSKGNFFTARDLFAKGIEPAALRLELIKTHYRSNANFTMQGLTDSQRTIERWRRVADASEAGDDSSNSVKIARESFAAALDDDLNIAGAIAAINTWIGSISTPTASDARAIREFDAVLGVLSLERPAANAETDIGLFAPGVAPDPRVIQKLIERRDARASKNFKRSDEIRDELLAMGYAIMDRPGGKVEVRRA
jgi:cysteinyl-tRNA synthetase